MNLQQTLQKLRKAGITPTAVSYARFSSDNQRDESIDAQQRAIREFAKENKLIITHEYVDRARSATSDDREQFQQMIKDANSKEFQFVLVHKLDRFSRNRRDSIGYRVALKKQGVILVSVVEQFDSDTPEGGFMEGIIELMAEFYSKNLSREVLKGLKENALAAKFNGGLPPYGYDIDKTTQKYIINEEEAKAVRIIFSMVCKQHTYGEIIDTLHEAGYRTKIGNYFKRNSLYEILRNPRYTGLYVYMRVAPKDSLTQLRNNHNYNGEPIIIPNGIPAIIDQATFERVQDMLNSRKYQHKLNRSTYLLTSKIVCGECKAPYVGEKTKRKSGSYYFSYRCTSRKNKVDRTCSNSNVHCDYIDKAVLSIIANLVFNEQLIPILLAKYNEALAKADSETSKNLAAISNKLAGIDKAVANIINAIEVSGSTSLLERLKDLEATRNSLLVKQDEIRESQSVQTLDVAQMKLLINMAKELVNNADSNASRRLVDTFIEKVLVYKDRIEVQLNAAPFLSKSKYAKMVEVLPRHPI